MEIRKISPQGFGAYDTKPPWTRWEKWGKASILRPRRTPKMPSNAGWIGVAPKLRIRDSDGLIYKPDTYELFQADAEMLAFLKSFQRTRMPLQEDIPQEMRDAIRIGIKSGVLDCCDLASFSSYALELYRFSIPKLALKTILSPTRAFSFYVISQPAFFSF